MSSISKRFLHLFILSSFAIAQPLFSLLGGEPAFFVIRRSDPVDILALTLGLLLLVPLPMLVIEGIAGILGAKTRWAIHLGFVGMLVAVIFLPYLNRLAWPGPVAISGALILGALVAGLYARKEMLRGFIASLAPVLLVFPLMFLGSSSIRGLLLPQKLESAAAEKQKINGSLVMVVFDEFPSVALLDEERRIDPGRYPNLAALASVSTWYPNAMTNGDRTRFILPSLLTGRGPEPVLPTANNYPENLFTLLAGSVELNVSESTVQLCPPSLCRTIREGFRQRMRSMISDLRIVFLHIVLPEDLTAGLPPITDNWMNFAEQVMPVPWSEHHKHNQAAKVDRPARFRAFLDAIDANNSPSLYFNHTLLPHVPFIYLPSGRNHVSYFRPRGLATRTKWSTDQDRIDRDYQLFLLQLGLVDTLIGELVERLEIHDLFDSSLIVITADHGASIRAGEPRRRLVRTNASEILPVPLLIKAPYQAQGVVDLRPIQTIDVLPTIADLYGLQIPWEMEGTSAAESAWPQNRPIRATSTWVDPWEEYDFALQDFDSRFDLLDHWQNLFGSGYGPEIWAFGPYNDLIGTQPKKRHTKPAKGLTANLKMPEQALRLAPETSFVPAFLEGQLRSSRPLDPDSYLAIGVNNVIRAVVPVDRASARRHKLEWWAVVPEESFQPGQNRVRVFLLRERKNHVKFMEASVQCEPS